MLAGNRCGKTVTGAYECTSHATGQYPTWWPGRTFPKPTRQWIAGDTSNTVRDILQVELLGPIGQFGTGMIPKRSIERVTWKRNVPEAVADIYIKHASGGSSAITLKCFAAGTQIKMADGSLCAAEDVALGSRVLCADGTAHNVSELHHYHDAPILSIETRAGKISVTPNHRMFTVNRGEVLAGDLRCGDVLEIACPSAASSVAADDWLVKMTALMIGDGCLRAKTPFFTCNEPPIVAATQECLPDDLYIVPVNGTIHYKISSTLHKNNRLKTSLERDGIWNLKSPKKFIPPWAFRLPREQRVVFQRWLWGCDGTINGKDATYVTASVRLANDVRLMLWDFGIHATIKHHPVLLGEKTFDSYHVYLSGRNRQLFSEIGKLNRSSTCTVTPRPRGPSGEIVAISPADNGPVYCITVDETHELIAEGFRVGNSYDQGRESFQGTSLEAVWLDEEPPMAIYAECLLRTMTTDGMVLCTFTPLLGLSDVVLAFCPGGKLPDPKYVEAE